MTVNDNNKSNLKKVDAIPCDGMGAIQMEPKSILCHKTRMSPLSWAMSYFMYKCMYKN